MFKAVILMQLGVIMYIESKKSDVFVLVFCTYAQSLNDLQQPDLTGIFATNNIYSWVVCDLFQRLIYKYYLQLSFDRSAFSFPQNTKDRRLVVAPENLSMTLWMTILIYVLRTVWGWGWKISISMCTHCVVCVALDMLLIVYVLRRLLVWGLRSKND